MASWESNAWLRASSKTWRRGMSRWWWKWSKFEVLRVGKHCGGSFWRTISRDNMGAMWRKVADNFVSSHFNTKIIRLSFHFATFASTVTTIHSLHHRWKQVVLGRASPCLSAVLNNRVDLCIQVPFCFLHFCFGFEIREKKRLINRAKDRTRQESLHQQSKKSTHFVFWGQDKMRWDQIRSEKRKQEKVKSFYLCPFTFALNLPLPFTLYPKPLP